MVIVDMQAVIDWTTDSREELVKLDGVSFESRTRLSLDEAST
jgi:hypothetical protein